MLRRCAAKRVHETGMLRRPRERDTHWQLHVTIELADEDRALAFERYLKSGSGRACAKRHFD